MSFHCASLAICARATEVAGAELRSMQLTAVTSPLSLPIPSNAAIIAAVGNYDRRDKTFGHPIRPDAAIRIIAMFEAWRYFVVTPRPTGDEATRRDGWRPWSTTGRRGQQSLPEIVTRLTHRCDPPSREKSSIRVGRINVFAARLPDAERLDRNQTTRRHPVGGSSLVRAMLVARARSAED
jgi:hypothetical protein